MSGLAWFSLQVRTRNLERLRHAIQRWRSLRLSEIDFSSGHPVVDILWRQRLLDEDWPAPLVNIRLDRESSVTAAITHLELAGEQLSAEKRDR